MDTNTFANISEDDILSSFGSIFTDPDEDDVRMIEKVRSILDILPPIEADFVDLYFFRHVKQTDIAAIFGVSQPTVCYRLNRAIQRIKYYLMIPRLDLNDLRSTLSEFLTDPIDVDIMVFMFETTCQSETAKRLGVTQGLVRHRFIRSIDRMKRAPHMMYYADMFAQVSVNLNILREVRRPFSSARTSYILDT
jgi:DNA-directed RNA polymerase specialized sigma24 family protein